MLPAVADSPSPSSRRQWLATIMATTFASSIARALPANRPSPIVLDRPTIDQAVTAAERFLLSAQRPGGNFLCLWQPGIRFTDTNEPQVQAQCLWAIAQAYREHQTEQLRNAVRSGIQFFVFQSRELKANRLVVRHPYGATADTATIAFVILALDELVRTDGAVAKSERATYLETLQQYANFLLTMQTASGRYHARYHQKSGLPIPGPVPRTDGIILLALSRTASLLKSPELTVHLNGSFQKSLAASVNAEPGPDYDEDAPLRFAEFGLQALAEFATATANADWQRECVRIASFMAAAMPDPRHRFERIMHLAGLAASWPIVEQYGNAAACKQYAHRLQEEFGLLLRYQLSGPSPLAELPTWPAAAGALAIAGNARDIPVQPTAELLTAGLNLRRNLFPSADSP